MIVLYKKLAEIYTCLTNMNEYDKSFEKDMYYYSCDWIVNNLICSNQEAGKNYNIIINLQGTGRRYAFFKNNSNEEIKEENSVAYSTYIDYNKEKKNSFYIHSFFDVNPSNENTDIADVKYVVMRQNGEKNISLKLYDEKKNKKEYKFDNIKGFGDYQNKFLKKIFEEHTSSTPKSFICFSLSIPYFPHIGTLMIENISEDNDDYFVTRIFNNYRQIQDIIHHLKRAEQDLHNASISRKLRESSIKSAKAAIMSRNMSHNLGSHVMFYIKQKLQSVSKIVDNKVLENIIPGNIEKIDDIIARIKENKDIELPFLVGLGRFINYLQERQDYIATIATDYIPANSTISFKDFIYDELKPDLRYERHCSQNNDAGWKSGNLLLDYIAYSEGYRSCDKIEILFGDFDGHNPIKGSGSDKDFQKLREFNIAVPGGVIGRQAIFSIFENIIRNAAKHSERRKDNKLVLQLSLLDKNDELFQSDKFITKREEKGDTISGKELAKLYEVGLTDEKDTNVVFDKYHVLRIKIDMPNDPSMVENLVTKLADPYIEDGHINESSKGLKEMRISAAWLRGYSIDTEIPANDPPALSIYTEPYSEDNSKVTISYILCIPRPCRVAFIDSNNATDAQNKILAPYGCKVFTDPFKLKDEEDRDQLINEIANYEIVCMPSDYKKNTICPSISSRYIADDKKIKEILNALSNRNGDEQKLKATIRDIYRIWYETAYSGSNSQLVIADEKAFKDKEKECEKLNDGKEDKDRIILKTTSQMLQADCTDNIIYSTHFKGLGFDTTDYGQMLTASACIESITGNNSTARILRQDEWNEEWKYKLLSSGLAKVAIFDERIFNSFIMRDSASKHDMLFPTVDDIRKAKEEKQDQDFYDYLKGYEIHEDDASDIYYNLSTIEEVLARYNNKCKYNCDVAQRNHERRIYAFDIRNVNEKRVDIVSYNVNIVERVGAYVNQEKDAIITIAKISRHSEIGHYDVELCDDKKVFETGNSNIFDYISIHQGVLDKIYTAFGIKDKEVEKYKVTNALHRCFSKQETPTDVTEFLPNFIIHSGRSKPSKDDMPQKQPFVQFAAIDHAVKDCKYTLVELLATAHYEK